MIMRGSSALEVSSSVELVTQFNLVIIAGFEDSVHYGRFLSRLRTTSLAA